MSWKPEVDELNKRGVFAEELGGKKGRDYQHSIGKKTARERIEMLLDKTSFREMGKIAGKANYDDEGNFVDSQPSNAIIGKGLIDGRKAALSIDDFTIRGGSSEATISDKWLYIERYALEMKMPLIRLVDSAGGSVKLLEKMGHTKIPGYPSWPQFQLMGEVPVVGIALGACAGLGAIKVGYAHFSVMVKGTSQVFAAGPPVVKAALKEDLDKEELGGWRIQTRDNGAVDNAAKDEQDAFDQTRRFLSYMPQNVHHLPPRIEPTDARDRREEDLLEAIPRNRRQSYIVRKILQMVLDIGSVFEIAPKIGPSFVTCLARLNGYAVGVMANDPNYSGGAMTRASAMKMEKFIDLCDTFHIPIVNFADVPGVMPGLAAEKSGTIRAVLKCLASIEQSQTPWVTIIMKRAFGLAGGMHGRKRGINLRYAWPSAYWGSIPLEGGIWAAYRKDIEGSKDPEARLVELEKHYAKYTSPFRTAEQFAISDIIDPRDTREILCDWVEEAYEITKSQLGPVSKTMRP
ncbi:MAG: propionyl-CoA carboxylase [Rhodospirillaceae bacterium]|nr:propionyl-CoA carboxylase [Rhodospirillaceae bacterium]